MLNLATKADLERFATKEDLERFATREELAREIALLRAELHRELNLQTWRFIGALAAVGSMMVAAIKWL